MAKKIVGIVKLQLNAGKATMQPPVGPALGPYAVSYTHLLYNNHCAVLS